jgi:hypothetical protein
MVVTEMNTPMRALDAHAGDQRRDQQQDEETGRVDPVGPDARFHHLPHRGEFVVGAPAERGIRGLWLGQAGVHRLDRDRAQAGEVRIAQSLEDGVGRVGREIELHHVAVRPSGRQQHQILGPVHAKRLEQAFGQAGRAGDPDVQHRQIVSRPGWPGITRPE